MRLLLALLMMVPLAVGAAPKGSWNGPQTWGSGPLVRPVVDPQTLLCVGVKDGYSLNQRCVDECVVNAVGSSSYLQRREVAGQVVEAYVMGGDYVCPQPRPMTEEVLAKLRADAERVVSEMCGEGNLVEVHNFTLVPIRERAEVSATVWCKRKLAL